MRNSSTTTCAQYVRNWCLTLRLTRWLSALPAVSEKSMVQKPKAFPLFVNTFTTLFSARLRSFSYLLWDKLYTLCTAPIIRTTRLNKLNQELR
jgi:hypothetical protein